MSFADPTPLEDVLKYIKQATTTPNYAGIPIYVDPMGLEEATATLDSTVTLDLEGVPLKTTLRLMLKQIGLAYCVRDGVLIISSVQGINEELREAQSEIDALNTRRGRLRRRNFRRRTTVNDSRPQSNIVSPSAGWFAAIGAPRHGQLDQECGPLPRTRRDDDFTAVFAHDFL